MNPNACVWHLLTGEFPPRLGGVSDYSRVVAEGLANAGGIIHVWTPLCEDAAVAELHPRITVHREITGWKRADFERIGRVLDASETPAHLLVQFAPNAFHRVGLNFELARWLQRRKVRGDHIHLMFHEVTYIVKPGDSFRRRALAFLQREIVRRLLRAADRVDIAIPYWERMLRPLDHLPTRPYHWRPPYSNVVMVDDPTGVALLRQKLARAGQSLVIGTFGTFASDVVELLRRMMLPLLLSHSDRAGLLIGRGSDRTAEDWIRLHPELEGRLSATGAIDLDDVSRHIQTCDLMIQPYPGGVCAKRGSIMANLSHGVAVVTNSGEVTEPIWTDAGSDSIAVVGNEAAVVARAEQLLGDREARLRVGCAALALYNKYFAAHHTIDALIAERGQSIPAETARS